MCALGLVAFEDFLRLFSLAARAGSFHTWPQLWQGFSQDCFACLAPCSLPSELGGEGSRAPLMSREHLVRALSNLK